MKLFGGASFWNDPWDLRPPMDAVGRSPMCTDTKRSSIRCMIWIRIFWSFFAGKNEFLGGGFKYFLFSPLFGEMIQFD